MLKEDATVGLMPEHSAELYEQYSNLMHVAKLRLVTIVYIRSQKIEIHGKNWNITANKR